MEGSKAVAKARKQEVVICLRVVSYLVLVAGAILVFVSFAKERNAFLLPIGVGLSLSSSIFFVMKWVAVAALTYIYKNE